MDQVELYGPRALAMAMAPAASPLPRVWRSSTDTTTPKADGVKRSQKRAQGPVGTVQTNVIIATPLLGDHLEHAAGAA